MNKEHADHFRKGRAQSMKAARRLKKAGAHIDHIGDRVSMARFCHRRAMMFGHPHKLEEWLAFQKTVEPWEWYADDVYNEIAAAADDLGEWYKDERDTQASNRPPQ